VNLKTATEEQLRDYKDEWPKTIEELTEIITTLEKRQHNYGTCVYAMSIAATATFHYIAHKLGVTGFQASRADLDILKRTRGIERFRIVNYKDLLYPQYRDRFEELAYDKLLAENREWLATEARALLGNTGEHVHQDVRAHWEMLARLN
jgi:hypothetical protein